MTTLLALALVLLALLLLRLIGRLLSWLVRLALLLVVGLLLWHLHGAGDGARPPGPPQSLPSRPGAAAALSTTSVALL